MSGSERFTALFGPERGASLPTLREQLSNVERELENARAVSTELAEETECLRTQVVELTHRAETDGEALTDLQLDCEHLRYLVMYPGEEDPMPEPGSHHGEWTPGRPYLGFSHCWKPGTRECYRAVHDGAPAGQVPGNSFVWRHCEPGSRCPSPSLPPEGSAPHPVTSGLALRQSQWWWDDKTTRWRISGTPSDIGERVLRDEHLLSVIRWLHGKLGELWRLEVARRPLLVPCPVNAYPSAADWLADLPVYRALQQEKRRRGLRWPPNGKPWLVGDSATWGR